MTDQSTTDMDRALPADDLAVVELEITQREPADDVAREVEATDGDVVDEPEVPPELDQRSGPVARYDERHSVLWIGAMPIPFRLGESRNSELLELLAATIRHLRGLDEGEPCPLRRSELRLLARLLDLADPDLRPHMRRHLGNSRREAGDPVAALRRVLSDREIGLD